MAQGPTLLRTFLGLLQVLKSIDLIIGTSPWLHEVEYAHHVLSASRCKRPGSVNEKLVACRTTLCFKVLAWVLLVACGVAGAGAAKAMEVMVPRSVMKRAAETIMLRAVKVVTSENAGATEAQNKRRRKRKVVKVDGQLKKSDEAARLKYRQSSPS